MFRPGVLLGLIIAVGVARILATLPVYNQTVDEPWHLATGMEWLGRGSYRLDELHPPLARVATATLPYVDGLRPLGHHLAPIEGSALLGQGERYVRTLVLARAGNLAFFLIAILTVFAWTRGVLGPAPALLGALFLSTLPPVLAHSALATTDIAAVAGTAAAVFSFALWLHAPSIRSAAIAGGAVGFALLLKFSTAGFVGLTLPCVALAKRLLDRRVGATGSAVGTEVDLRKQHLRRRVAEIGVALATAFFVVWAGYRFSLDALANAPYPAVLESARLSALLERSAGARVVVNSVLHFPWFPAPGFVRGVVLVLRQARYGRYAYLFGHTQWGGWWYFFPVAIAVKTPLPFLLLSLVGLVALTRGALRTRDWRRLVPVMATAAILISVMPSNLQIGLRHVLPIYPFLAIAAAAGVVLLWELSETRRGGRAVIVALIGWHLVSGALAHPDYLPYFNELVGRRPERVLVDSDLDWGQDLWRLDRVLREHKIDTVHLHYFGSANPAQHLAASVVPILPSDRPTGWVAVSVYPLMIDKRYAWLRERTPVARAGHSIYLYHVGAATTP